MGSGDGCGGTRKLSHGHGSGGQAGERGKKFLPKPCSEGGGLRSRFLLRGVSTPAKVPAGLPEMADIRGCVALHVQPGKRFLSQAQLERLS